MATIANGASPGWVAVFSRHFTSMKIHRICNRDAIAPWQHVYDEQFIEVDIPDLDVHGACISIIGALEENFGFLLSVESNSIERADTLVYLKLLKSDDAGAAPTYLFYRLRSGL